MMDYNEWCHRLVIVRGGGDIATGTVHKLFRCGFPLLILEIENPRCIRRTVSFSEAVYDGEAIVEGVKAVKASAIEEAYEIYQRGHIPLMVDPEGNMIRVCHPAVLVDAILAKRNLGTRIEDAPLVIAFGPGFVAGEDAHAVIETKRGHDLGRVIYEGEAASNTSTPGVIAGYGRERVIHAPADGCLHILKDIGQVVSKGDPIAEVIPGQVEASGGSYRLKQISHLNPVLVTASIDGIVRGMLRDGYSVKEGMKMADIDPRLEETQNFTRISDKARCIAGGVLEVIISHRADEDKEEKFPSNDSKMLKKVIFC